jgi:DNA-binding Lrp family transcriptional regulator
MERIRRHYPYFFGGAAATQIVAALAKHGCMTADELAAVLGWKSKTDVHHRARRLIRLGVIVKYTWLTWSWRRRHVGSYRRAAAHSPQEVIFALDRRHPWHVKIRTLGRALTRGFPLPHPEVLKHRVKRPYFGPRSPMHPMPTESVLEDRASDRVSHRVLMLLAYVHHRSKGVPITKLAKLVGASRYGLLEAIRCLERWGIVRSAYVGWERCIVLDRRFCADDALRQICRVMDRDLGREFAGLARARRSQRHSEIRKMVGLKSRRRKAHRLWQREAAKRRVLNMRTA